MCAYRLLVFTNETVARNYNIIGIYNSTLIVEKRVAVVSAKLDSTSKEYDGKSYVYEVKEGNYNLIDGSLAQEYMEGKVYHRNPAKEKEKLQ